MLPTEIFQAVFIYFADINIRKQKTGNASKWHDQIFYFILIK
jgi:hypothetical protein